MTKDVKPISVLDTLGLLNGEFNTFSKAFTSGEFSIWMGSGISPNSPDLGELISRAIEHLRCKFNDEFGDGPFSSAFRQALGYTNFALADLKENFDNELSSWSQHKEIKKQLWGKYSDLLDIIIDGEEPDYMLWNAVNVRSAFVGRQEPSCEHLCIAILILEGAITKLASANWDGCLENAIAQIAGSTEGILQVVVNPNQLRDPPCPARLVKFHGCIVHATEDPEKYRSFLTATLVDILQFADRPGVKAIHDQLVSLASETKTLTAGLSLQDINLQQVFSKARATLEWKWPCDAPVLVFCEEKDIKDGQTKALRITYGDSDFARHKGDILKNAHLPSWPQKVLISMVLKLLLDKLLLLANHSLHKKPIHTEFDRLTQGLEELQQYFAMNANGNLNEFVKKAITSWSRFLCLFRNGTTPISSVLYHEISKSSLANLLSDGNATSSGFGELALGLSLIGSGVSKKVWEIGLPDSDKVSAGAFTCLGNWDGAQKTNIFFVKSASAALELKKQGALIERNTVIIHSDDSWAQLSEPSFRKSARSPGKAVGRNGNYEARHVSLKVLVDTTPQFDQIETKFVEEVTI